PVPGECGVRIQAHRRSHLLGTKYIGRLDPCGRRRSARSRDGLRGDLGYTRTVPAERIAQNLAFINWTVLTGLAFGSFAAVVLARMRTDATRGFLAFTAACAVGLGILAWLSDVALPLVGAGSAIQ